MIKIGLYCTSCGKLISSGELNSRSSSTMTDTKELLNRLDGHASTISVGNNTYDVCDDCYDKIGNMVLGSWGAIKDLKDVGAEIKICKKRGKTND